MTGNQTRTGPILLDRHSRISGSSPVENTHFYFLNLWNQDTNAHTVKDVFPLPPFHPHTRKVFYSWMSEFESSKAYYSRWRAGREHRATCLPPAPRWLNGHGPNYKFQGFTFLFCKFRGLDFKWRASQLWELYSLRWFGDLGPGKDEWLNHSSFRLNFSLASGLESTWTTLPSKLMEWECTRLFYKTSYFYY